MIKTFWIAMLLALTQTAHANGDKQHVPINCCDLFKTTPFESGYGDSLRPWQRTYNLSVAALATEDPTCKARLGMILEAVRYRLNQQSRCSRAWCKLSVLASKIEIIKSRPIDILVINDDSESPTTPQQSKPRPTTR